MFGKTLFHANGSQPIVLKFNSYSDIASVIGIGNEENPTQWGYGFWEANNYGVYYATNAFSRARVVGSDVYLYGAKPESLILTTSALGWNGSFMIEFIDLSGAVKEIDPNYQPFTGNTYISRVHLPLCRSIPYFAFAFGCNALSSLYIPACTNYGAGLGGGNGNDLVFFGTSGLTITLTANDFLRTNNSGGGSVNWPDADGDIADLDSNNALTVYWV